MGIKTVTVGIAGTAKNTGKTTTTSVIIEQVYKSKWILGLTSIGYDGETFDNITGLPKPRVHVMPGTFLAIAEKCIIPSTAQIQILERTEIETPLGKIIIGEVKQEGLVVVAGPNKSGDLKYVLEKLKELHCRLIIVDGALNRIAPMVETDGIILTTGASRNPEIKVLAKETQLFWEILNLPAAPKKLINKYKNITIIGNMANNNYAFPYQSLLTDSGANEVCAKIGHESKALIIPGIVNIKIFKKIIGQILKIKPELEIVFADPIKVFVTANLRDYLKVFKEIKKAGGNVSVLNRLTLFAITVNPFYPNYRLKANLYEAAYIDKEKLKKSIGDVVGVPVINSVDEGGARLLEIIEGAVFEKV